MLKIKNYFKFLILFLCLFLFVEIATNVNMRKKYEDFTNYIINTDSPKVLVKESKVSYSSGYITGSIINDTGTHIKDKYLEFDFYNKYGIYLGTEYKEIKYFNIDEKISFDIKYKYTEVGKIEIDFVDKMQKPQNNTITSYLKNFLQNNLNF